MRRHRFREWFHDPDGMTDLALHRAIDSFQAECDEAIRDAVLVRRIKPSAVGIACGVFSLLPDWMVSAGHFDGATIFYAATVLVGVLTDDVFEALIEEIRRFKRGAARMKLRCQEELRARQERWK